MTLDEEVRAAAAIVLERGGEHETAPLARLVLEEMGEEPDKEAVDSVCKALQRWKQDGGPAAASATKRNKFGKALLVWSAGTVAGKPAAAKPKAGGGQVAAVLAGADPAAFERIAAALEKMAAAYAFSVGFKPEPPAATPKPVAETPKPAAPDPSELELLRTQLAGFQAELAAGGLDMRVMYALRDVEGLTRQRIAMLTDPGSYHPEDPADNKAFLEQKSRELIRARREAPADYAAAV